MLPLSYNIRNLRVRLATTLLSALGIAFVTAIFCAVLALAEGFRTSQVAMGDADVAVILRQGATSAVNSVIDKEQARIISSMEEVRDPAFFSPELVLIFQLKKSGKGEANVLIRGVTQAAFNVHPNVKIVEGRMMDASRHEVIVGRSAARRYSGLSLGSVFRQCGVDWTVVGVFSAEGSGFESEVWTDMERAMESFDRREYSIVSLVLADTTRLGAFAARVKSDRRLQLIAKNELVYYSDQASGNTAMLRGLGIFVCSILAVGAVFGAVNTMYAAVGSRTAEIATLRALGFRRRDILYSFLFEAAAIGLIGGVLGCVIALPVNFMSGSVLNFQSFSDVAFRFRLTPEIAVYSILWAVLMGGLGGIFPAIRATRMPVAAAFRDVN